jgi:uncharacterized protein
MAKALPMRARRWRAWRRPWRRWLVGAFCLALAAPAQAAAPVWVVKSRGAEITLFGSVHLLPKEVAWRSRRLDEALAGAQSLWFEIPIDGATSLRAQQMILQRGALPAGERLSQKLDPAEQQRLVQAEAKVGATAEEIDRVRPWMADLTLTAFQDQSIGATATHGVEWVLQSAVDPKIPRRSFETIEQQVGFLADSNEADQLDSLRQTISDILDRPDLFDRVLQAWSAGDLKTMTALSVDELRTQSPHLYDRLIVQRNAAWMPILRRQLARHERAVVVVGVGHLVGPDGLVAKLKAAGYKVEGPFLD